MPYDLFLGVPKHHVPTVVAESGMCVDGWIPVDPVTLEAAFTDVYAVGDVTSVGTPKAGVFAEGQASIVADTIIARARDAVSTSGYDGRGICYVEFGHDQVARVDVRFVAGAAPTGIWDPPSEALRADKAIFGSSRVARWFSGR
jgi:sulfide:quinone oxidoreductase